MKEKKLNLFLLITLIVGTIIGGGIFNSPTDLILKANPMVSLIGWLIGGLGILALALVFYKLTMVRPNLNGGIYSYAKAGFGEYIGFNSFWGYWLGAIFGNIAFISLFFKTLNSLLATPLTSMECFIGGSVLLWLYTFISWHGVHNASVLNAIITIAKVIPLVLVVIVGIALFQPHIFNVSQWTTTLASTHQHVSFTEQIGQAMSTIVWCFVGIEAAVSMSRRAKKPGEVGIATIVSFIIVWLLYALVSLLPMGIVSAHELSVSSVPLATVLEKSVIGHAGSLIIKFGLLISLLGALLSWFMIGPEIAYVTSMDHALPRVFSLVNRHGVPGVSLLVYTVIMQAILVVLLLPKLQTAYTVAYTLATITTLVSYLLSALYGFKVAVKETKDWEFTLVAAIASLYAIYTIFSTGITYAFASLIIFALGIPVYLLSHSEMNRYEKLLAWIIGISGVLALIMILHGGLNF